MTTTRTDSTTTRADAIAAAIAIATPDDRRCEFAQQDGNVTFEPRTEVERAVGRLPRRDWIGGLLSYYRRVAA